MEAEKLNMLLYFFKNLSLPLSLSLSEYACIIYIFSGGLGPSHDRTPYSKVLAGHDLMKGYIRQKEGEE